MERAGSTSMFRNKYGSVRVSQQKIADFRPGSGEVFCVRMGFSNGSSEHRRAARGAKGNSVLMETRFVDFSSVKP